MLSEIKHTVNGITYYSVTDETKHSFCLALYVRAGSMYEREDECGITHLFEHTVFRNVKAAYGGELYRLLVKNGISFNATTYKEFVCFTVNGALRGFPLAAEILSHVFDPISVSLADYEAEKRRIKSEIREASEKTTLAYFGDLAVWHGTSLERPITGSCASVDRISRKKLDSYRTEILTRDNLFFCLTGNAGENEEKILDGVLATLNVPETAYVRDNTAPLPDDFGKREFSVSVKNESYYRVKICFDTDNSKYHAGVRDVLYSILFEGETALMFLSLSEDDPLIYSYDSTLEEYRNASVIKLEYEVSKRNLGKSVEKVFSVCAAMKRGKFEFDDVLSRKLSEWDMLCDNVSDLNWDVAYENHILCDVPVTYGAEKLGRYADVTKESVCDMARDAFTPENLTVAVKGDPKYVAGCSLEKYLGILD